MHVLFRYNREPCVEPHCLRCTLAFRRPPQLWRYTGLLERAVKHVDLFLSPSRFTFEAHRAVGSPHRCATCRTSCRRTPSEQVVTEGGSRPYFLYVGRLERLKGVQVLIDAFRHYRQADLLIVGEGTMGAELRRRAEGLDHVRFLGRLHPSELAQLYDGAVALVVPSIGYEVFGIVALEAFARRKPAIAHDLGALTEVIEDSAAGCCTGRRPSFARRWTACSATTSFAPSSATGLRRLAAPVERGRARHGYYDGDRAGPGATPLTAVILTYHAIEDGPRPLCIEPALFGEHAAVIADSGAKTLTVLELGMALRDGALPERAVAITFDDGCESVVTNAAPLLAERGLQSNRLRGGRSSRRNE